MMIQFHVYEWLNMLHVCGKIKTTTLVDDLNVSWMNGISGTEKESAASSCGKVHFMSILGWLPPAFWTLWRGHGSNSNLLGVSPDCYKLYPRTEDLFYCAIGGVFWVGIYIYGFLLEKLQVCCLSRMDPLQHLWRCVLLWSLKIQFSFWLFKKVYRVVVKIFCVCFTTNNLIKSCE